MGRFGFRTLAAWLVCIERDWSVQTLAQGVTSEGAFTHGSSPSISSPGFCLCLRPRLAARARRNKGKPRCRCVECLHKAVQSAMLSTQQKWEAAQVRAIHTFSAAGWTPLAWPAIWFSLAAAELDTLAAG